MKVLLTGGSGDLGQTLVPRLLDRGDTPVILDVRAPRELKPGAVFIHGSVLTGRSCRSYFVAAIASSISPPGTASTRIGAREMLTISLT